MLTVLKKRGALIGGGALNGEFTVGMQKSLLITLLFVNDPKMVHAPFLPISVTFELCIGGMGN